MGDDLFCCGVQRYLTIQIQPKLAVTDAAAKATRAGTDRACQRPQALRRNALKFGRYYPAQQRQFGKPCRIFIIGLDMTLGYLRSRAIISDATRALCTTSKSVRMATACCITSQSLAEPMRTPTRGKSGDGHGEHSNSEKVAFYQCGLRPPYDTGVNHGYYFLVKSHKATTWQSQAPIHHSVFLSCIFNKIIKNDAHSRAA